MRHRRIQAAVGMMACALVLARCGDSKEEEHGVTLQNDAATTDAPTQVQDAATATCLQADDAKGVFVRSAIVGDAGVDSGATAPVDAGDADAAVACTRSAPCFSINQAIAVAGTAGKAHVYLATGTYAEDVALANGVTLFGGFDASSSWNRSCALDPSATVIKPSTGNVTIRATDLAAAVGLDTLTLASKGSALEPNANGTGRSLYGLLATGAGTNVTLSNIVISVADAGKGKDGAAATPAGPTPAPGSCAASASTGTVGAQGASRQGAAAGAFDASGFVSSSGVDGEAGSSGSNGVSSPSGGSCSACGKFVNANLVCESTIISSANGVVGCGGLGGGGGSAGGGGGSSVALFASGAHVSVSKSALKAGAGGAGGTASLGAPGGAATNGQAGADKTCCAYSCSKDGAFACACAGAPSTLKGGTATNGLAGGSGGNGGGGAGGFSYAVVKVNNAVVDTVETTFEHKTGGTGGGGGSTQGANGLAGDVL